VVFAREALVRALSEDVKYKHQRNQIFYRQAAARRTSSAVSFARPPKKLMLS
jgi:hypothetical protein